MLVNDNKQRYRIHDSQLLLNDDTVLAVDRRKRINFYILNGIKFDNFPDFRYTR